MGVYFKGMKAPKNCDECWFHRAETPLYAYCTIGSAIPCSPRPDGCPMVEIPPHGRLIDADAEVEVLDVCGKQGVFPHFTTTVSKFLLGHLVGKLPPTIIPADPAEEGE